MAQPSIVFIPGSFSPAYFYEKTVESIHAEGYEIVIEALPSASSGPGKRAPTTHDDAAFFHKIIEKFADEGKDVILVAHSYGGLVGTEASKDLSRSERSDAGKPGGISKIVYLSSSVPEVGKSLRDLMGGLVPDSIKVEGEYMSYEIEPCAKLSFSDLPLEEGMKWARQLPHQSTISFEGQLTHPGYKYIPAAYIVCEDDLILPPEFQYGMIKMIEEASGKKVDVYTIKSGHCPNASFPVDVAKLIVKAVKT